jgi:hypothetical protein
MALKMGALQFSYVKPCVLLELQWFENQNRLSVLFTRADASGDVVVHYDWRFASYISCQCSVLPIPALLNNTNIVIFNGVISDGPTV